MDAHPTHVEDTEVTPEMIEAGLRFLHEAALPMLTARAEDPEFVADFLRAALSARQQ